MALASAEIGRVMQIAGITEQDLFAACDEIGVVAQRGQPALAMATVARLGGDTGVVEEDDNIRTGWRMACVGDIALLEKPVHDRSPKRIDCYWVDVENFADGNGKKFKLDHNGAVLPAMGRQRDPARLRSAAA